jgi:hypothetical protein
MLEPQGVRLRRGSEIRFVAPGNLALSPQCGFNSVGAAAIDQAV